MQLLSKYNHPSIFLYMYRYFMRLRLRMPWIPTSGNMPQCSHLEVPTCKYLWRDTLHKIFAHQHIHNDRHGNFRVIESVLCSNHGGGDSFRRR